MSSIIGNHQIKMQIFLWLIMSISLTLEFRVYIKFYIKLRAAEIDDIEIIWVQWICMKKLLYCKDTRVWHVASLANQYFWLQLHSENKTLKATQRKRGLKCTSQGMDFCLEQVVLINRESKETTLFFHRVNIYCIMRWN